MSADRCPTCGSTNKTRFSYLGYADSGNCFTYVHDPRHDEPATAQELPPDTDARDVRDGLRHAYDPHVHTHGCERARCRFGDRGTAALDRIAARLAAAEAERDRYKEALAKIAALEGDIRNNMYTGGIARTALDPKPSGHTEGDAG